MFSLKALIWVLTRITHANKERARIEVYNGSEIDGIAYQLGRKIVNSGGDVVRYGNAP